MGDGPNAGKSGRELLEEISRGVDERMKQREKRKKEIWTFLGSLAAFAAITGIIVHGEYKKSVEEKRKAEAAEQLERDRRDKEEWAAACTPDALEGRSKEEKKEMKESLKEAIGEYKKAIHGKKMINPETGEDYWVGDIKDEVLGSRDCMREIRFTITAEKKHGSLLGYKLIRDVGFEYDPREPFDDYSEADSRGWRLTEDGKMGITYEEVLEPRKPPKKTKSFIDKVGDGLGAVGDFFSSNDAKSFPHKRGRGISKGIRPPRAPTKKLKRSMRRIC